MLRYTHILTFTIIVILFNIGCSVNNTKTDKSDEKPTEQRTETTQDGTQSPIVQLPDQKKKSDIELHEHDHTTAYTTVPKAPKGDTFFKTIQFPKTPPDRPDGHYQGPKKNPFPIPDYVKKYPDHFTIDAGGFWHVRLPADKTHKLETHRVDIGTTEEEFSRQIAEVVGDGLDVYTTNVLLEHFGGLQKRKIARELLSQAYQENPNNLYVGLSYYTGYEIDKKFDEAEVGYRRLVKMHPGSMEALYKLALFISENHPEPYEAIPYFEKVYQQAPHWYAPLFHLGLTYYSLGDYEKSLAYLQASEVFTGPQERSSLYIHLCQRQPSMIRKEDNK